MAKILKIELEYNIPERENPEKLSMAEITWSYLQGAILQKYPQMEGQLRRQYGRIQRKVDEAMDKGEVELEDNEFEMLEKSLGEAKYPPLLSKYVNVLEEEMERAQKSEEKKSAEPQK